MHLKYNINRHDKGLKDAPALFPNPGGPVQKTLNMSLLYFHVPCFEIICD